MELIWNTFFYHPLLNLFLLFLRLTGGSVGLTILLLTLLTRLLTYPLSRRALLMGQKYQALAPELSQLKERFKDDKKRQTQEQLKLFAQSGYNPVSGCFPQIIQLLLLIALYQAFAQVLSGGGGVGALSRVAYFDTLRFPEGSTLSLGFIFWDLSKSDGTLVLPFLAAATQLVLSLMTLPKAPLADDGLSAVNRQMLFLMPLLTFLFGLQFPAGLMLYWWATTLFSLIQQYQVSGWGGLSKYWPFRAKGLSNG